MAGEDVEKRIIFRLVSQVAGEGGVQELRVETKAANDETKKAQATLDAFDARMQKTAQSARTLATAEGALAGSMKAVGTETGAAVGKVTTLSDTVAKAGKAVGAFVGIDASTKAFLTPLIKQADQLGKEARETAGDLDFLKQKAKEAGQQTFTRVNVPVTGPGPVSLQTGGTGAAIGGLNQDARQLAATLLLLGEQGQEVFDGLGLSIQQDEALLKELIATAAQTPQGAAALAQDLTEAQVAALNTAEAMGAITAEQRPLIEQATKLQNAQGAVDGATKKTVASYGSLRAQLRQAKAELDALVEASEGRITPEIIAAAKKAGELEDRFEDLNATVSAFNPDKKFQAITGVIQNLAGGFTAVQGALALVGVEGESVAQALTKVQGALALTQGLQALFGGLKDNLRNIRLLMASTTVATKAMAVAEKEAAVASTIHGKAVGGLTGVFNSAKAGALKLWATLIANPYIAVAAAAAVIIGSLIAFARRTEEAKETVDEFYDRLKERSEKAANDRDFAQASATIQSEITLLQSKGTEEDKLAAQRRKNAIDEAAARQKILDLDRDINDQQAKRAELIRDATVRFAEASVAFDPLKALTSGGLREGLKAAVEEFDFRKDATKEQLEGIKKVEDETGAALTARLEAQRALDLQLRKAEADEIKGVKEVAKARADAAKKAADEPRAGTIGALQREQQKLQELLNKQLLIGSPEFFTTAAKYMEVTRAITNAQDSIKGVEVFPAGSLNDLNQELAFLKNALQSLPPDAANFDALAQAAIELQKEVDALNDRLKPKEGKDTTAARLAELQEAERSALAFHDLDERAAVQRATTAKASEEELKTIEQQFQAERLKLLLDFELKRLEIMRASGSSTEAELTAQKNKIRELRAELSLPPEVQEDKSVADLVANVISAADQIAQAGIDAWQAWTDAHARSLDAQIANQRAAVDAATEVADKGNAAVLEEEKKRLQSLLDERRKAAQVSAGIAQIEAAANAIVAISRAAAEGGGLLSAVSIASTLIALTAGIAQARSLASSSIPSFYGGGRAKWSELGGYTGKGDPRQPSAAVGAKPYQYEREEFIMDHATTGTGNNRQEFERILRNRVDIGAERRAMLARLGRKEVAHLMPAKMSVRIDKGMDDRNAERIVRAIEQIPTTKVHVDEEGVTMLVRGRLANKAAVNNRR